ncbi:MAG TPA: toll/interleukin-1 receptor domain-containing protein [Gaiellaceae bacterium]|nr:toll/interleukin-1 receptor domain-containing protein [Gaiellaceae bacterium]
MTGSQASIFISYSHEDKDLARALAAALDARGLRVWIDEGELKVGDSLIERIATAIAEIDFFLALVSEASRKSNWCRKELALAVTGELGREGVRVLPVRVAGAEMPDALADVLYLSLDEANIDEVADKIAAAIPQHQAEQRERAAKRREAERAARRPSSGTSTLPPAASAPLTADYEPIRITGIVEEGVGQPRNDGSAGSALYRIPLRLSRRPHPLWARRFVETWNHPPRWTTMHRPGIASVSGDTIILDGTTMEELERYHVETLRYVLEKVNEEIAEHERRLRAQGERQVEARRQHEATVREISGRLKFDY